jgi:tetratricopeptide (TPR) repeat protein
LSLHYASEEVGRKFASGVSLAFARQGEALLRENRAEEALRLLVEGVRLYPGYITGFLVLGRAHKDAGRLSEAKAVFEKALRLDSRCPAALSLLAWIEETQKESAERATHLSALAEQEPWDEEFQAAAHRTPPAAVVPTKPPPVVARVDHLGKSDPVQPAVQPVIQAVKPIAPVAPSVAPIAAAPLSRKIEAKIETYDEFDEDLEENQENGDAPPNVATVTLAEIYFQQGLKDQALQIYRQLLERQPDNETVKKRLMEIEASTA